MKSCKKSAKNISQLGRGGGQVVSVLAFYLSIRVRIPLNSSVLFCNVLEKNENKQEEAGDDTIKKHTTVDAFRRNASFEKGAKCLKLSESFSIVFALAQKM